MPAPTETPAARLKRLRPELRYWQMMVRLDLHSLIGSRRRAKEIAAQMRAAAAELSRPRPRRRKR